jgi:hypothetical protein
MKIGNEGLANQIFMYAAAIRIQEHYKLPLLILPTLHNKHSKTDYRFLFKSGKPVEYSDPGMHDRLDNARVVHPPAAIGFNEWSPSTLPPVHDHDVVIADNFYQNVKSIHSVVPHIRKEFLPELRKRYPTLKIDSTTSAFMHVRRGDYGENLTLPASYFHAALKELETPAIQTIYIASNDIAWCKEQAWATGKAIEYVDTPDELYTLYLMSQCKAGAVLSNSSYSLWGALLGADTNPQSIIVYPSRWWDYGPDRPVSSRELMLPERWTMIQSHPQQGGGRRKKRKTKSFVETLICYMKSCL